jgi:hypothetical protein
MTPGEPIGMTIDQTLTQDATGTLVMLELEAMGLDRVRTEVSAQYVDHNLIQEDHKNPDDHLFLRTACERFGIWYSRPGNGISHPVHQERFGRPGRDHGRLRQPHPRGRRDGDDRDRLGRARRRPGDGRRAAAHPHARDLGRRARRRAARLGQRQGRHPRAAAPPRRRRRHRPDHRVPRRRARKPLRDGPPRHLQHGRGARRDHLGVPRRRRGAPLPRQPGPQRTTSPSCARTTTRPTTTPSGSTCPSSCR